MSLFAIKYICQIELRSDLALLDILPNIEIDKSDRIVYIRNKEISVNKEPFYNSIMDSSYKHKEIITITRKDFLNYIETNYDEETYNELNSFLKNYDYQDVIMKVPDDMFVYFQLQCTLKG